MAREYGPGLGYDPVTTAVLATLAIAGSLVLIVGYLGFRYDWWQKLLQRRADRRDSGHISD